jgi:hypothetical protein
MLGNRNRTTTSAIDPQQALAEAEAIINEFGYAGIVIETVPEPLGTIFVAKSMKVVGANTYQAQAIGSSKRQAVNSLVKTITRR